VEKPWTASKNSKNGTVHSFLHRAWETGERMPVSHSVNSPAALRRGDSLGLSSSLRTEHTIDSSQTLATQSTRPPNRGRLNNVTDNSQAAWTGF
jgi:hypothetical protein